MDKLGFNMVGFVGVVEDRNDPEKLGRVRVRCFGFHTESLCGDTDDTASADSKGSKNCIDTTQLPWAVPVQPNTFGSMNGIGHSSMGLVEGTWVFGMFIDGETAQQPMILGAIPGVPECINPKGDPERAPDDCDELSNQDEGFYDPRKEDDGELDFVPRPPKQIILKSDTGEDADGLNSFAGEDNNSLNPAQKESPDQNLAKGLGKVGAFIEETERGENYPLEGEQEYQYRKDTFRLESDVNRLARNENIEKTLVQWKKDNLDTDIPTADIPDKTTKIPEKCGFRIGPNEAKYRSSDSENKIVSGGNQWTEPETKYDAVYPYNRVMETESGHIEEWDDTHGAERYHRFHRTGTYLEIGPDGSQIEKIVGSKYTIVLTNDKIHIEANADLTIDKAYKIYVNADNQEGNHLDLQIGENSDLNINAGRNVNVFSRNDINLATENNLTLDVGKDLIMRVGGDIETHVAGNTDTTILGNSDLSINGNLTELISGASGVLQEIQNGEYIQRIENDSYVISGGLMTEIGMNDIAMNPLNRPSDVNYSISPEANCVEN